MAFGDLLLLTTFSLAYGPHFPVSFLFLLTLEYMLNEYGLYYLAIKGVHIFLWQILCPAKLF